MTIRAQDSKIFNTMIIVDSVDMIKLQDKGFSVPPWPLTTFDALVGETHCEIPLFDTDAVVDMWRVLGKNLSVGPFTMSSESVWKVQGNLVFGAVFF